MKRREVEIWLVANGYEKVWQEEQFAEYEKNNTTIRVYDFIVECYAGELYAEAKYDNICEEECLGLALGSIASIASKEYSS